MAKPPIEFRPLRPTKNPRRDPDPAPRVVTGNPDKLAEQAQAALEAYKAAERAKVLARVKRHREKKKGS